MVILKTKFSLEEITFQNKYELPVLGQKKQEWKVEKAPQLPSFHHFPNR